MAAALRELNHAPATLGEFNLPDAATPVQVIQICRVKQHELMTASRDFLDAILPNSGRREIFNRVLVYLQDAPHDHALAIHRLFERYKRLTPGRLYTITGGRVKVRQLPGGDPSATQSASQSR